MSTIHIYSDGTKSQTNTFTIEAIIWGEAAQCQAYEADAAVIISNNPKLGADFQGFHAYNLNEQNWSVLGTAYEQLLALLTSYIHAGRLRAHWVITSQTRYAANAGYLKELFKKQLADRESTIGKHFAALQEKDFPALYHRIDMLASYWQHRDKFGAVNDEFYFFPDSEGKVLQYSETQFPMSGNLPVTVELPFFSLVTILANAFAELLKSIPGWSTTAHRLHGFEPLKWKDSYLIQTCDALANFLYCGLRVTNGLTEQKYQLKANLLNNLFATNSVLEAMRTDFGLKDGDVACTNPNFWGTIDLA